MGIPLPKRSRRSPSPASAPPFGENINSWRGLAHQDPLHAKPNVFGYPGLDDAMTVIGSAPRVPDAHEQSGRSHMERLSPALLLKIVQMSQPTAWDLCRMSCVSRAWRATCAHRSFWTRLRVGTGSLRPGVEDLAPKCTHLTELFVDEPRCDLHILHPLIVACSQSLQRIVIDCDRDATERNDASISSILWLLSLYCKNVESIELTSSGNEATLGSLEGRTMWYLTAGFRQLRSFTCLAKGALSKQSIYLMAIAWRDLECVRLNMAGLSLEDLLALRKCTALRALELVGGQLGSVFGGERTPAAHPQAPDRMACDCEEPSCQSQREEVQELRLEQLDWAPRTLTGADARNYGASQESSILDLGQAARRGVQFHPSLELLVLNRIEFTADSAACLALMCPSLKRILVSGDLCPACRGGEGPCHGRVQAACVRRRVEEIQNALAGVRAAMLE